jgi:two-component sensor histidine kinase
VFQKFRFSTRAHLLALGLAIITPLLIFAAVLLFQYANYERERTERLAEQLAINIGGVVDAEIEQALAVLRGLAASAALSSRNYPQFYEEARRALGRENAVIILRDVEGQQFVNTQVPPGGPLRRGVPLSAEELAAYSAGNPFVSNVYRAPQDGEVRYAVGVPVMRDGKPELLLGLTSSTMRIAETLKQATPSGWVSTVGDRAGVFVARSERHEEVTGRPAQRAYYEKAVGRSGHFQLTSLFGVELLAGYYNSDVSGWLLGANIPLSVVSAPYKRSLMLTLIAGGLALGLSILLAYLVSRSFASATGNLTQQAIALGEGRTVTPFETHLADIALVSDALESASVAIKRREQERELLTNELNHRVKNTLAAIQAIAHNTLRHGVPPELRQAFIGRLMALSKAHDLLTEHNWRGAELHDLMEKVRNGYASDDRLRLSGPRLWLRPNAALAVSLTMNELATNAAKYGALSNGEGRVDIRWNRDGQDAPLIINWVEQDGPAVRVPERKGFGWRLIHSAFAESGGKAELDFSATGLRCRIEVPPTQFSPPPETQH